MNFIGREKELKTLNDNYELNNGLLSSMEDGVLEKPHSLLQILQTHLISRVPDTQIG